MFTIHVMLIVHRKNHDHRCYVIRRDDEILLQIRDVPQHVSFLHDVYVPKNDVVCDVLKW
jgi:hypothetical protein